MIRADTAKELAKHSLYVGRDSILEDLIRSAALGGKFGITLGFYDDMKIMGLSVIGKSSGYSYERFYERPANFTIEGAQTILSDLGYTAVIVCDQLRRPRRQELHISWE